jgi:hypothetical protein
MKQTRLDVLNLGWSHPGLEHRIELLSDTETKEVAA